ncbi:MAG: DUF3108 domain-containing protein [Syntrophobacteraceae bacterium]|jgi:hypothetical protein|nr:DUF3108 domain-containing protein [Syntrophobacteraceae bacterium]
MVSKVIRFLVFAIPALAPAMGWCDFAPSAREAPFKPGEKLTYELSWEFLPAGTARLEVSPVEEYGGGTAHHFVMTVETNAVIDRFYMVRDRLESYTDRPMKRSLLYRKKQREGRHRRDIEVTFDWGRLQAEYSNFGKKQKPVAVVDGTFDPLSMLYAFRLMPLAESTVVEIPVSDGKKSVMARVRVVGRERIGVNGREYGAYVLEPDLKDLGGVFRKSKGAKVRIWVTDDERRLPVKLTSRVAVGSFVAELREVRHGSPEIAGKGGASGDSHVMRRGRGPDIAAESAESP